MYYTIALTFASTLNAQTRWSEAYSKESFKDPEMHSQPIARKVPLGVRLTFAGRSDQEDDHLGAG